MEQKDLLNQYMNQIFQTNYQDYINGVENINLCRLYFFNLGLTFEVAQDVSIYFFPPDDSLEKNGSTFWFMKYANKNIYDECDFAIDLLKILNQNISSRNENIFNEEIKKCVSKFGEYKNISLFISIYRNVNDILFPIIHYLTKSPDYFEDELKAQISPNSIQTLDFIEKLNKSTNRANEFAKNIELSLKESLAKEKDIALMQKEIQTLKGNLYQKDQNLLKLNFTVFEKDRDIQQLNEKVSKHENEINQLNSKLLEKDKNIQQLKAEVSELNSTLLDKDKNIQQLKDEVSLLNSKLLDKDKNIQQLKDEVSLLNFKLSEKERIIEQLNQDLSRQNSVIQRLNERLTTLENRINQQDEIIRKNHERITLLEMRNSLKLGLDYLYEILCAKFPELKNSNNSIKQIIQILKRPEFKNYSFLAKFIEFILQHNNEFIYLPSKDFNMNIQNLFEKFSSYANECFEPAKEFFKSLSGVDDFIKIYSVDFLDIDEANIKFQKKMNYSEVYSLVFGNL